MRKKGSLNQVTKFERVVTKRKKNNARSLPNFAMTCDRAKLSDNMGSMLACALLIDYGIVTKDDYVDLIDPSKGGGWRK